MTLHVYSDASYGPAGFAGAYIVGNRDPVGVRLEVASSMEAEMVTLATAVRDARKQFPTMQIIANTDLIHIHQILLRRSARGSHTLRAALDECAATIKGNSQDSAEHRRCHRHARVVAGILGTEHPNMPKQFRQFYRDKVKVASIPKKTKARDRYKVVVETLANHNDPVSEVRLSQECGLGLHVVHKVLRTLESQGAVVCEKPDCVAGCDLQHWKWRRGASRVWGTLLGDLLAEAGVMP